MKLIAYKQNRSGDNRSVIAEEEAADSDGDRGNYYKPSPRGVGRGLYPKVRLLGRLDGSRHAEQYSRRSCGVNSNRILPAVSCPSDGMYRAKTCVFINYEQGWCDKSSIPYYGQMFNIDLSCASPLLSRDAIDEA